MRPLVLASSSPYRKALFERLGLPFVCDAPQLDERPLADESPRATAERLAEAKARAVLARHPGALVIGSDQVADCGGLRLEKPGTDAVALQQLAASRGHEVVFHTALCVIDGAAGKQAAHCDETRVHVRADLDEAALRRYIALDRPLDCAGSARIEALGVTLLEHCSSEDPTALVGLPMIALCRILRGFGVDPLKP